VRFKTQPYGAIGGYLKPNTTYCSNSAKPQDSTSIAGFYAGPGWKVQVYRYIPDRASGQPWATPSPASGNGTIYTGGMRADGSPYYFTLSLLYNYRLAAYPA
jgi:hypothetical protein